MNKIITLSIVTAFSIFLPVTAMIPARALKPVRPVCHPCTPFAHKDIAIAKSRHFYASLDPRDLRVPRVFLQTHAHIAALKDWTPELWQEFGHFEKSLETALNKTFKADLVNVACLMNLAGEEGTHTHWHFIPRLAKPITITHEETGEQHIFEDPCYGKPYDMNGKNYRSASPAIMMTVIKEIQKNLDISNLPESALKKKLKNVIFDFGGVILDGGPRYISENAADSYPNLKEAIKSEAWKQWMKGTLTKEVLIDRLSLSHDRVAIQWLVASTLSKERGFIDETVTVAKQLAHKGYRLYLLSNFSRDAHKTFIENEPFFTSFSGILCSFQAGLMKPDRKLYQLLLDQYNLKADESIFIDDSAENVRAAQELAINGIVYKKGNLARDLMQNGIMLD